MVGDPLLREAVKFVDLRLGIVFWILAHINPVKKELLDLVAGKVRVLFLDALNGLLKIEPFCVWPDQFALLGVELDVRQQIPENIVYLYALLALGRAKELSAKILSCGCSRRCLPMRSSNRSGPSGPVLCWRDGAWSGISIMPSRRRNTSSPPIPATQH